MDATATERRIGLEHAALRHELSELLARARQALGAGPWPTAEADALVRYLTQQVLEQTDEEERELFPLAAPGFHDRRVYRVVVDRLCTDHAELRDAVREVIAAVGDRGRSGGRLLAALQTVEGRLLRHLADEEALLFASTAQLGVEPAA